MQRYARHHIPPGRALATCAAIGCFALSIALVPGRGGTNAPAGERPQRNVPETAAVAPVDVRRDAFAPLAGVPDDPPAARAATTAAAVRVTATVSGARPAAIVESAQGVRAVGVGDALDGTTVSAISGDGLTLADGRKLAIGAPAP